MSLFAGTVIVSACSSKVSVSNSVPSVEKINGAKNRNLGNGRTQLPKTQRNILEKEEFPHCRVSVIELILFTIDRTG